MRPILVAVVMLGVNVGTAMAVPFDFTFQSSFSTLVPPKTPFLSSDLVTLVVQADNSSATTASQTWVTGDVTSPASLIVTRGGTTIYSATYGLGALQFSALTDASSNLLAGTFIQDSIAPFDNTDSFGGTMVVAIQQGGLNTSTSVNNLFASGGGTSTAANWTVTPANIDPSAAPEPSTVILAAFGMLGLVLTRRRRRRD